MCVRERENEKKNSLVRQKCVDWQLLLRRSRGLKNNFCYLTDFAKSLKKYFNENKKTEQIKKCLESLLLHDCNSSEMKPLLICVVILSACVLQIKSDPRLMRGQKKSFLIHRDIIDEWIDYFREKLISKNENFPKTNLPSQIDKDNKEHKLLKVKNSFYSSISVLIHYSALIWNYL